MHSIAALLYGQTIKAVALVWIRAEYQSERKRISYQRVALSSPQKVLPKNENAPGLIPRVILIPPVCSMPEDLANLESNELLKISITPEDLFQDYQMILYTP